MQNSIFLTRKQKTIFFFVFPEGLSIQRWWGKGRDFDGFWSIYSSTWYVYNKMANWKVRGKRRKDPKYQEIPSGGSRSSVGCSVWCLRETWCASFQECGHVLPPHSMLGLESCFHINSTKGDVLSTLLEFLLFFLKVAFWSISRDR